MNIGRNATLLEINGEEYELLLDFESAILFDELTGTDILSSVKELYEGNTKTIAYFLATTLRKNDEILGLNFVKKINFIAYRVVLMDKIGEMLSKNLPEEDGEVSKKKQMMMEG